jgi:hypothetical protein
MAKVHRGRGNHDAFGSRSWVQMIGIVLDSRESSIKTWGSGSRSILEPLPRVHPFRTASLPNCACHWADNEPANVQEAEP